MFLFGMIIHFPCSSKPHSNIEDIRTTLELLFPPTKVLC
uniref:Uncharacterized protein n=1 Tax=Rhizophora mucronata TaxID=61149 RepID=A0A2P2Q0F0_RHIMU